MLPPVDRGPVMASGALSLAEICALPVMAGVEVRAGSAGLDRTVVRLNVMTLPDITRWTKEQELLLTSGYPLPRTGAELARLVAELDASGVSALAVKLDGYLTELDPETLAVADELGFPILEVPQSVAFDDILSTVLALIANRQAVTLTRAQDVGDALLQVSLRGGLDDIVASLSAALDGAGVLCADERGELLAEHLDEPHRDLLREHGVLRADGRLSILAAVSPSGAHPTLAVRALPAEGSTQGHLLAVREYDAFDEHERLVVEQAAMVAALSVSKTRAVHSVTRRFATNALQSLLTGPSDQVDDLVASTTAFGWELRRPARVLAARLPDLVDAAARERVTAEWESVVRSADRAAATGAIGTTLVAVCAAEADTERLAAAAVRRIAAHCSVTLPVGISEPVDEPGDLYRAWPHARTAAELAARLEESPQVRRYEALGLLRLLDAVTDPDDLDRFLQHTLGPVLALPERQREEMLDTLRVLVHHRFNAAETARAMHFHYNTVRYRVRKLECLLGEFTQDSHVALCIGVALEALSLIPTDRRSRSGSSSPGTG